MRTLAKGNAAEAAVLNAFVSRDFAVLLPFGEGQPYDFVVDLSSGAFLRVQCKTARAKGGCLLCNSRTTDHGRGRLPYLGLADVFGVFFPPNDSVYLIPVCEALGFEIRLRLEPARNNQRRGIRLASDYVIDSWTRDALHGVVTSMTSPATLQAVS
jgi:hypothetical protein